MKILVLFLISMSQAFAMNPYSKNAGSVYEKMPAAKKGGTLHLHILSNPKVLNPLLVNEVGASGVMRMIYARLMEYDRETNEYFPNLAEKLDVSRDHKEMTYTLRKGATWQDGTPITADDAEFTYQKLFDPKVEAAPHRATVGNFKFEKLDDRRFKIMVENPGINTLVNIHDDFVLIQKKQFAAEPDFNKSKGALNPVGSGPYRLKSFSRDQKIELERVKGWWGDSLPVYKGVYNFGTIVFRIISDNNLAYEKFMKGEIDILEMNSEMFGNRVKGVDQAKFGMEPDSAKAVWAKHFKTEGPGSFVYIGWNTRIPVFSSKKTRQALAQLIDYETINTKLYFGTGVRSLSPFGTLTPNTAPDQKSKAFSYQQKKALDLLKADGWADTDGDSVLDKVINGKKVRFEFILRFNSENQIRSKIAQIVKEQFKKAGIVVNVQAIEWNTLIGEMENRNFEAIISGWARGNFNPDARQIWHSKSFENKGSNFIGYSNPEVDALIEQSEKEMDLKKRQKVMQKIASIIYDDQPYAFLVEIPGFIMGAHSKVKAKKWALRYDDEPAIWQYSME